jgi:hypothetical protein
MTDRQFLFLLGQIWVAVSLILLAQLSFESIRIAICLSAGLVGCGLMYVASWLLKDEEPQP